MKINYNPNSIYKKYRNNLDNSKNIFNLNECIKIIDDTNLKKIDSGNTASAYYVKSNKCGMCVLKKFLPTTNFFNIKREIDIINMINNCVVFDICPNFILTYHTDIEKKYILMEYADGTLGSFLKNELFYGNKDLLIQLIFQILIGILVLQKNLFSCHYDLHVENVFYKKIKNDKIKFFEYNINGKSWIIPNLGYLFMIADYGNLQTLLFPKTENWIDNKEILTNINTNTDLKKLTQIYSKPIYIHFINEYSIDSFDKMKKYIDMENDSIKEFIKELDSIDNELKQKQKPKLDDKIKMNKLGIFLIENNLYNFKNKDFINEQYIYSDNYKNFVYNIFNSSDDIMKIIEKYFSQYTNITYDKNLTYTFNIKFETFN